MYFLFHQALDAHPALVQPHQRVQGLELSELAGLEALPLHHEGNDPWQLDEGGTLVTQLAPSLHD